jgi:hypothetical protein
MEKAASVPGSLAVAAAVNLYILGGQGIQLRSLGQRQTSRRGRLDGSQATAISLDFSIGGRISTMEVNLQTL